MVMRFCPTCNRLTGFKRHLGWSTFFMVLLTGGLWLLALPFYPCKCISCGITSFDAWKMKDTREAANSSQREKTAQPNRHRQKPEEFEDLFELTRYPLSETAQTQEPPSFDMVSKICSSCAETIKIGAIKCRFCGETFPSEVVTQQVKAVRDYFRRNRVCCDDEGCTGIIGQDGLCGVCGKPKRLKMVGKKHPHSKPSEQEGQKGSERSMKYKRTWAGRVYLLDKEDEYPIAKPFRFLSDPDYIIRYKYKCPAGCHVMAFRNVEIKGTSFPDRKASVRRFLGGPHRALALRREPDNKYDPNAIQVIGIWGGDDPGAGNGGSSAFIGYVPREIAEELAPLMDEGKTFIPTIRCMFLPHPGCNPGIRIDIWE